MGRGSTEQQQSWSTGGSLGGAGTLEGKFEGRLCSHAWAQTDADCGTSTAWPWQESCAAQPHHCRASMSETASNTKRMT